jgi:short-subunit dehydrogenase
MTELRDARVLLTGATGGIGNAIARELHSVGAKLILTGRRNNVLKELAEETGGRMIAADLAKRSDIERLVDEAGEVDVLVANAGLPARGPLTNFEPDFIELVMNVNLTAPILLARLIVDAMIERGRGHLVFISSMAGKVPRTGSALYSANKFGLRGFAASLRQDLHGTGVGVSTVFPGFIRGAGMFAEHVSELPRGVGTSTAEDVARATVRAIERDQGEADVAPLPVRAAGLLSGIAPDLVAVINRRSGAAEIAQRAGNRAG